MSLDELIRNATSRAGVVRVRNALNPMLWACAVISPTCFGFAYLFGFDPILRYALVALGSAPILVTLCAYIYFMVRHPDRLQSEEFILRQQELMIIARKAAPPIPLDADVVEGATVRIESKDRRDGSS